MQTFLPKLFLCIADIETHKMLVEIALKIILQSLKVFQPLKASQSRTKTENSENLEITSSTKFIIEGIYKTYFEHKCIK